MRYFEHLGLRGSVLGLGCGSMMGRVGHNESVRALGLAWDNGINVFDVARSYGFGDAEGVLGEFLTGRRRDAAVVVTKFGIWPAQRGGFETRLKPVVRMVRKLVIGSRRLIKRVASRHVRYDQFNVPTMHASLAESLRQLRTDYVDVLLLHGAPATVIAADDLMAALLDEVASGAVRFVGVSSGPDVLQEMIDADLNPLQAMQFTVNMFDLDGLDLAASAGERLVLGMHAFGGLSGIERGKRLLEMLSRDETIPAPIRAHLAHVDRNLLADVVLNVLLRGTCLHTIAPSMTTPANLLANVHAVSRSSFDDTEVALLRQRLLALSPPPMSVTPAAPGGPRSRPTYARS